MKMFETLYQTIKLFEPEKRPIVGLVALALWLIALVACVACMAFGSAKLVLTGARAVGWL